MTWRGVMADSVFRNFEVARQACTGVLYRRSTMEGPPGETPSFAELFLSQGQEIEQGQAVSFGTNEAVGRQQSQPLTHVPNNSQLCGAKSHAGYETYFYTGCDTGSQATAPEPSPAPQLSAPATGTTVESETPLVQPTQTQVQSFSSRGRGRGRGTSTSGRGRSRGTARLSRGRGVGRGRGSALGAPRTSRERVQKTPCSGWNRVSSTTT